MPTLMSSSMASSSPWTTRGDNLVNPHCRGLTVRVCVCVCVCTVGAEQGLKLSQQADGVQLTEESVVTETVPQFDDEAADESGELHTHTVNIV